MSTTRKVTSAAASSSIPAGNAIITVDGQGAVTPVSAAVIPERAVAASTVTPEKDTQWLRVAVCSGTGFFSMMSVIGTFVTGSGHGDGSPTVIAFGGTSSSNIGYLTGRISAIVKSGTVTKCRGVSENGRIYIDILFAKGGGAPVIGLIGAHGVDLLTPSVAPEPQDSAKVSVYTL